MSIRLAPHNKWNLFVGMVCELLAKHEYNGNIYEMAISLDMTFDELKHKPISMWLPRLEDELMEYKNSREGRYNFNSNFH